MQGFARLYCKMVTMAFIGTVGAASTSSRAPVDVDARMSQRGDNVLSYLLKEARPATSDPSPVNSGS